MYPHGQPRPRPWRGNNHTPPPMFLYQPPPPPPPMLLYPPPPPPYPYGPAAFVGGGGGGHHVRPPPPPPYHPPGAGAVPYYTPYFGHHHHHPMAPPPMPAAAGPHNVHLQPVTAANFAAELDLIGSLLPSFPYIIIDTEYPGTVHHPPPGRRDADLSPDERYGLLKANVDELPVVQLGITLCDAHGNLPFVVVPDHPHHVGGERAWEVDFSDFDVARDRHAPQSVAFLRSQGVDFTKLRSHGVSSAAFGAKLAEILLTTTTANNGGVELTWVAFGGAYDLAYMVKMLGGGAPLPETREAFVARVRELLGGGRVFDAKYMAENCGRADLRGVGLRSVAANLGAPASSDADLPWLAGTKSFVAYRVHTIMRLHVLSQETAAGFEGIIDGLQ